MRRAEGSTGVGALTPIKVLLCTNVGPSILRSYFDPLCDIANVASVEVIRDSFVEPFAAKSTIIPTGHERSSTVVRIAIRIWETVRQIRRRRPDVLMVMHWFPDGYYLLPLARFYGIPLIAHIIGGRAELASGSRRIALSRLPDWLKRLFEAVTRSALNRLQVVTFTGTDTRDWFALRGVTRPVMLVQRPTVRLDADPPTFDARSVDVVYVGRVDADKRFDRVLRTLVAVARRKPDLRVMAIGLTALDASRCKAHASDLIALGGRIQFLGKLADVRPHLRDAKVFLLPSDSEGRSLAMMESMACGTVPVVTGVGDHEEVMRVSGGGVAVPVTRDEISTCEALAGSVLECLQSASVWRMYSDRARAFIASQHSHTATMQDWRTVLESLAYDAK